MQEFNCTKQKPLISSDDFQFVAIQKYVCSSAYELTFKLNIFVKAMSFRLVIAHSQIYFEAFYL